MVDVHNRLTGILSNMPGLKSYCLYSKYGSFNMEKLLRLLLQLAPLRRGQPMQMPRGRQHAWGGKLFFLLESAY